MADFYTKTNENGMVEGPFSTKQLKILAGKGTFRPEHLVSVDGGETWHPARMLVGLEFPTVARTPQTTPADPQPQSVVPHLGLAKKSGKKRYIAFAIVAVSAIGGFWLTSATPDSPNAIDKGARLRAFENKLDELRASAAQKRTEAQAVEAVPSSTSPPPNTKPGDSSTEPSTSSKTAEETIAATDNNTETAVTADSTVAKRGKRKKVPRRELTEAPVTLFHDPSFYPDGKEPSDWMVFEGGYHIKNGNVARSLAKNRQFGTDRVDVDTPAVKLFKAYWSVTEWEQRLPMALNAKAARPLMRERYKSVDFSNKGKIQTHLVRIRGPATELRVGESAVFYLTWKATLEGVNGESYISWPYKLHMTAEGLKLDWIGMDNHQKAVNGERPWGKIANDDTIPEVTFKKLDIVGERYRRKRVKVVGCKFYELDNDYVDALPSVRVSTNGSTCHNQNS